MLKRFISSLSIVGLSLFPNLDIKAEEKTKGVYFVGSIGAGQMADIDIASSLGGGKFEFDTGFSGNLGIGYDFGSIRTEFTYNSTNTDLIGIQGTAVDVGVDVTSFLISAAYDWRAEKKWQPYIQAGLGTSEVSVDLARTVGGVDVTVGDDNISSAQLKLGVNYEANDSVDIYGEIWGQALDDFTIGTIKFIDCGTSGISLGLRVKV